MNGSSINWLVYHQINANMKLRRITYLAKIGSNDLHVVSGALGVD